MSAVTIPWLAACAVLGIAGIAKLRRPAPTMGALRAAHLPASRSSVLALGAGELALAVGAVATGWPVLAAAVAALHAGFAAFVAGALRRGGMVQSCGCFGTPDVPAGPIHVVVDLAVVAIGVAAALGHPGTAGDLVAEGASGAVAVGLVALATYEVIIVMTVLPRARLRAAAATAW